jgi:hypothetical protein
VLLNTLLLHGRLAQGQQIKGIGARSAEAAGRGAQNQVHRVPASEPRPEADASVGARARTFSLLCVPFPRTLRAKASAAVFWKSKSGRRRRRWK